jgi:hypothetical protein
MRQPWHKILTRTLLILSVINFALAAPAAVRERPEVRLGANVARNVTAASEKRWDPLDEGGSESTNVPGPDHAPPPSLDSTGLDELMRIFGTGQHRSTGSSPPSPDNPGSLTGSNDVPSPGSPTGSRLPVGSTPVAGSLSPPPPSPHPSQPGSSEDRLSSPPGFSGDLDTLSSTGYQPIPPQSPGVSPESHSLPSLEPFPTEFWDEFLKGIPSEYMDDFLKGKIKRRISGSDAVNLAQDPRSRIF